jgi:sugar/nucleoside kinase (ribokinase family)
MKIFGYGLVNVDDMVVVQQMVHDGKTTATGTLRQVGGPVPVALQTFTKLGGDASFCGAVGYDEPGKFISHRIAESVTESLLQVCQNGTTSRSIVIIEAITGARTIVNIPATNFEPIDVSALIGKFQVGSILHLDGRDLETNLILASAAKRAGTIVSIDLGTMRPGREALLSQCDIILASKSGSAGLTPDQPDNIDAQLAIMRSFGASVVGITLAEQGVVVGDQTNTYRLPAFQVKDVVDTNGAGDCFHGAFLYAYANLYENLQDITRFAQACVAVKITALGNDAGLPTLPKVMDFLSSV